MFLTVYLSNNDQHFTEVPITPETLCRDVVELCKEPGETDCHLSEMWRGSGKIFCPLINSTQWRKLPFFFFFKKVIYGDYAAWSTASFLKRLISLGLQQKCSKAHNLCNKHALQAISHVSQVEIWAEIFFLPHFLPPFFETHEVLKTRARHHRCFHGNASIRGNKVPITVFEHFHKESENRPLKAEKILICIRFQLCPQCWLQHKAAAFKWKAIHVTQLFWHNTFYKILYNSLTSFWC